MIALEGRTGIQRPGPGCEQWSLRGLKRAHSQRLVVVQVNRALPGWHPPRQPGAEVALWLGLPAGSGVLSSQRVEQEMKVRDRTLGGLKDPLEQLFFNRRRHKNCLGSFLEM